MGDNAAMTNALIDPVRLKPLLGELASRFDIDALTEAASSSDLLLERMLHGRLEEDIAARVADPIAEAAMWTIKDDGSVEERTVFAVVAKLVVPLAFSVLFFISLMIRPRRRSVTPGPEHLIMSPSHAGTCQHSRAD